MNLLMISGDRSILQGKKGAFFYTLEEFSKQESLKPKYWDQIDIICPNPQTKISPSPFSNVHFYPSPHGLWYQPFWILKKGKELLRNKKMQDFVMTVHDYPPFYNGIGARWLYRATRIPYAVEIHHIVGHPIAASLQEWIGRVMYRLPCCFKATVRRACKVRTVNHEVAEKLHKWGIPKGKIEVVPSLYLDKAALTSDASIRVEYDVVVCARLVANKGLFEVLQAISLQQDRKLLIIGDGPERARLEAKAKSLGISD